MSRYLPVLLVGALLGGGELGFCPSEHGNNFRRRTRRVGRCHSEWVVTVRNIDTGTTRTLVADSGDRYTARDLPLGNHQHCQTWLRTHFELRIGRPQCR
jgi:hypothetical protein